MRFEAIWGARWATAKTSADVKRERVRIWTAKLATVTPQQFEAGMGKVSDSGRDWFPTPEQFRAMCLPSAEELGHLDAHTAYMVAAGGNTGGARMTPLTWHAKQETGPYDLQTRAEREMWPKFKAVYERLLAQALAGKELAYPDYVAHKYPARIEHDARPAGGAPARRVRP